MAVILLRDERFLVGSAPDHAETLFPPVFPARHVPVVAHTACVVPFLFDPAAALLVGRNCLRLMKLQCLDLLAAILLGVSSAMCTHKPSAASRLARGRLHAGSSIRLRLFRLRTGSDFAPARLPVLYPVLHLSARVRRGCGQCPPGSGVISGVELEKSKYEPCSEWGL